MQEEPSTEQLLLDVQRLSAEVENLKRQKADLEILLEKPIERSHTELRRHRGEKPIPERELPRRSSETALGLNSLPTELCRAIELPSYPSSVVVLNLPLEKLIGCCTPDFYFNSGDRPKVVEALAKDGHLQNYELHCKK